MYKKVLILLFFIPFQLLFAQTSMLKDFPEGSTPEEIGKRLAYRFLTEKHALHIGKWIGYPETFYWNGALRYAYLAKDKELLSRLQDKFEPLFTEEKALQPIMNHVDLNMFGSLPLEFYLVTKDLKYRYLGLPYADSQWELPRNVKPHEKEWAEKGYSWQTRLWIDDMYMITIVQTRAYKVTKDKKYIDLRSNLTQTTQSAQDALSIAKIQLKEAKDKRELLRKTGQLNAKEEAELIRESQFQKAEYKRLERSWKDKIASLQVEAGNWEKQIQELKAERKVRSAALQQQLFEQFRMLNYRGEAITLCDIFEQTVHKTPPAGAGECQRTRRRDDRTLPARLGK